MKPYRLILQIFQITLSALLLLYILFADLYQGTFMVADWLVVVIDLSVKIIVDIILLVKQ